MKVEIKVLPEAKEPYAVIYASEITPEIRRTAALLETKNSGVVSVMENERIIVLRPDEIYMVRVENDMLYRTRQGLKKYLEKEGYEL